VIKHLLKLVWNRKRANALIVMEIFVSFLVIFAVLTGSIMIISNWTLPLGFQWHDVWDISMEFDVDAGDEADPELHAAVMRMLGEARAFPQVAAAGLSNTPPYAFSETNGSRDWKGKTVDLTFDDVSDGYADVMRMKVLQGRWFDASDDASPHQPIVLDANAAEAMFGSENPIGQKFEDMPGKYQQVIGVVEGYRKNGEPMRPVNMLFLRFSPAGTQARLGSHLLVRVHPGTPGGFEEVLVKRLQQVAPKISFRVRHMDQMRQNMLRTNLAPLVAGGIIGLFLIAMVTLGLTGVLWQNVTRRTREIGVRRAMGASGSKVNAQILLEVVLLATIAMLIGTIIILQLPVIGAFSLVTKSAFALGFAGALATIYALTILCGLYPSWMASRLTPAEALRYE
jgi:putative ABC transport system permease protein